MITKQQIKYIRSLHQKKHRDQEGVFLAEGYSIVNEAIELIPDSILTLVFTSKSLPFLHPGMKNLGRRCLSVTGEEFLRLSSQKTPQEVLAVIRTGYTEPARQGSESLILVLDKVRDPGNMGTIIRLADWFGVSQVICSEDTVDCYNPKVVQASMGAIFRVRVSYCSLSGYLRKVSEKNEARIYGTTMDGEDLYTTDLEKPAVIVMGNEANGISDEVLGCLDKRLLIPDFSPSASRTESLNVAIAAAITCAEFRRQTSDRYSK